MFFKGKFAAAQFIERDLETGVAPAAVNGKITLPSVPDARRNLAGEWQKYDAKATNMLFRTDYLLNDNWALLFEAGKARTERDRAFSQFQNYNPGSVFRH